ncbi:VWA domain-containing protein [Pseudahrensia aquimaris]|uniref:VWA domain-containing protein n=1 Tax=Pseudahrensia aquimaris TaxID=744461 RepID=A0ABW3FKQ3_9HYPH
MRNLKPLAFGLWAALLCGSNQAYAQQAEAPTSDVMIVFDGSGSMWGQIDGQAKIKIARETLSQSLTNMSLNARIGLIGYGHRQKGQCSDIETMVPVGNMSGNLNAIISAVNGINPKGKTPLSDAVTLAAKELKYTENAATVVLITDGLETCNADPCALARALERDGINFTAHVIGFGLSKDEGRQVACLAEETGGRYIEAGDGAALDDALKMAMAQPAPAVDRGPVEVQPSLVHVAGGKNWGFGGSAHNYAKALYFPKKTDADGKETIAEKSVLRDYGQLEPGEYRVKASLGQARIEQDITVQAGQSYQGEINFRAALVKVNFLNPDGTPAEGRHYVRFCSPKPRSKPMAYAGCRGKTLSKHKIHINTGEQFRLALNRDRQWNKTNATRLVTIDPALAGQETVVNITVGELAYGSHEKEFEIAKGASQ